MINCKCCGSNKLQVLIDFGMQPVAHNLLDSEGQEDPFTYPLCLHYCEDCGFIQINNPISPEQLYTKYNYCFGRWKSQPQIPQEIELINRNFARKDIRILEIGCNDGVFLEPLRQTGYKNIVGIEANPYAAQKAIESGFTILNEMFDKQSAESLAEQYHSFDLIIMRSLLEHIPNLNEFFEAINHVLGEQGMLFIEVPDFFEALKSGDCSTIWEEHPNYFTYDVLEFILNTKGYQIINKAFFDYSGGFMYVLAQKSKAVSITKCKKDLSLYVNFSSVVNDYAQKLKTTLQKAREIGYKVFLYGTGMRACTLVNGLNMGSMIDLAVDDQEEKQGHFMPGSHLPIVSFDKVSTLSGGKIFLLAVNHENEETVSKKILSLNNIENIKIISLSAPNDIFAEVKKLGQNLEPVF